MRTAFARELASREGEIFLSADKADERRRIAFGSKWGADVAVTGAGEGLTVLGWSFQGVAGKYELWVQYATAERRPVAVELNGERILTDACTDLTFGYSLGHQTWIFQGLVDLGDGANKISLSAKGIPHIRGLRLLPDAAESLQGLVRQTIAEPPPPATLADEPLFDFLRAVTPPIRHLVGAGIGADAIAELVLQLAKATITDFEKPQEREGFRGPFNGQVIRQSIFVGIDKALRFDVFVETGAYVGTTTEMLANFERPVFSCENTPQFFFRTATRLAQFPNVTLFFKDSRAFLRHFMDRYARLYRTPFFYLDAHWYNDLPLPEEIALIRQGYSEYVVMVDDFKHPLYNYPYDKYASGLELTLDYLLPRLDSINGMSFLFPLHPEHLETGAKRGTLVIAPDAIAERILSSGVPLFRYPVPS